MKIFILSITTFVLLFLPQNLSAQAEADCRKIFDKEMYKCLTDFNACQNICFKEAEKPDGTTYFNSGEIYPKCMKANQCHAKSDACREQALANFRACGKSDKQPIATNAKKETPKQEQNFPFMPIFNFGSDTVTVTYFSSSERTPTITAEDDEKVLESPSEKGSMLAGEWLKLKLDLEQAEKASAILSLNNFQAKVNRESVDLITGEVEFKSRGDIKEHPAFTVKTDNAEVTTKDTHFWVSYDKDKKQTLVGVYEGEVEVKTKDGKVVKVKPDGDKPGVVIVSQKLSPVKLALTGVVLVGAIGGVVLFLKRKKKR